MNSNRQVKFYVLLTIYDYDHSPRYRIIRHYCGSEAVAIKEAENIKAGVGVLSSASKNWLWERNIFGFIERIEGVYREETTRLDEKD